MKKSLRMLGFVMGCIMLTVVMAQAFSNDPRGCVQCHPSDSNVSVTVTQGACDVYGVGSKQLFISVSNTYPGMEGWAIFDGITNIKNGYQLYGTFSSMAVPANKSYHVYGVSGYGTWQTANMGGSQAVGIMPYCAPTTCVDSDGDGYYASQLNCGWPDCDDNDATIYPNATETARDGIDQDCNGYDLTIVVTKAAWSAKTSKLAVQASSSYGVDANLTVDGFGNMAFNKKTGLWSLTVATSPKPTTVTVSGFEGRVTVPVQ